ncbi:hypothetical protein Tco_0730032 [Tanacetum coccineum]|uniref:Uncharacterized protein n=1 Tax=Tanacetum coccineum TaxID=301880 RepID=A0ABQ4YRR1_9ASTR
MSGSSKGTKSQPKSSGKSSQSEEPEFQVADSDMPQNLKGHPGNDNEDPMKEAVSKRDWFTKPTQPQEPTDPNWNENPEGGDYPFDLTKPLPLVMSGNRQKVLVDYFFNNDLKYLQGGVSTITYTTSITKTKAAQYDLPGIEDMTFYGYTRGLESRRDVYFMKRMLEVTHVEEGDFLCLRINDIEDMLLLVVQNRLTNLSGDDVDDFTIALRMFTRSLVIQKRQDPQGFIYDDNLERNMLMRSDELYKFSDGTLTRLLTSLEDITKNIHMEYLPKRRWSSLEKKRAHIMIKAINKLQKERRMMRSLEKFVGGRHYKTDLRLLQ